MPNKILGLPPEHQPGKRKRVLLAGADPLLHDSISTLLSTMGWTCKPISGLDDVVPAIQQGFFDAVLLNIQHSAAGMERTILGIKAIRPTLAERIMVISGEAVDSEVLELIERYDLSHLPEDKVVSRLWSTLEDLVDFPAPYKVVPRNIQTARLLFDSIRLPSPAGVRSSDMSGRHLTYEHNNTTIDVLINVQPGSNLISLVGQVLDPTQVKGGSDHLPVVLSGRGGTLARTTTNRLGEFNLQFEFAENINLEIRVAERAWISVPLTQIQWAKERLSKRTTGT
jgi:hypothetical protein